MRISGSFVVGAIMGAVAVWLREREVRVHVDERTRGAREGASDESRSDGDSTSARHFSSTGMRGRMAP